jgi:VWFA-related protein
MKIRLRYGLALIAGAIISITAHFLGAQGEYFQQSIDAANVQKLMVQAGSGQIRIRGWDRPSIDIRVKKQLGQEVSIVPAGGELRVTPKDSTKGALYADLYVPARLNVTAGSSQADIFVHGIGGQVSAMTDSGKVHFFENLGKVQGTTNSGEIRFLGPSQYHSAVELKSQSGDINVTLDSEAFRIHAVTAGSIFYNGLERVTGLNANRETIFDMGNSSQPAVQLASGTGKIVIQGSRAGLAAPVASTTTDARSGAYSKGPRDISAQTDVTPPDRGSSENYPPAGPPRDANRSSVGSADSGNKKGYKVIGSTVDSGYSVRSNVDYINLNVSVRDRASRSIPSLRKPDFLIYEDGQPQQVEKFLSTETPFSLLLLLDVSGSTAEFVDLMKEASVNFLRQLNSQDEVAVAIFNTDVDLLADFSTRRSEAERAIRSIRSRGGTAFYDALDTSIHGYMEHVKGRKAIVVFTDGVDNQLEGRGAGSTTTFNQLIRGIQEEDTIIYPIFLDSDQSAGTAGFGRVLADILNGGVSRRTIRIGRSQHDLYEVAREQLAAIAEQTGGRMYTPRHIHDLDGVYQQIADDLRIQYTLSYMSTNPAKDGKWRRVQVRIQGHPDYVARTRLGYYASDNPNRRTETRP